MSNGTPSRGTRHNDGETTDLIAEWQINSHLTTQLSQYLSKLDNTLWRGSFPAFSG